MPTYQYACTECGHAFEQVQSFTDDALTVCPECEGRLRKVFNAVGVVFKGSGFYRNDSRGLDHGVRAPRSTSRESETQVRDQVGQLDREERVEAGPAAAERLEHSSSSSSWPG